MARSLRERIRSIERIRNRDQRAADSTPSMGGRPQGRGRGRCRCRVPAWSPRQAQRDDEGRSACLGAPRPGSLPGASRGLRARPRTRHVQESRGHFAGSPPEPSEIRSYSLRIRAAPGGRTRRARSGTGQRSGARSGRRRVEVGLDAAVQVLRGPPTAGSARGGPRTSSRRRPSRSRGPGRGQRVRARRRRGGCRCTRGCRVPLHLEVAVGQEGPVRAGGDLHLERVVQVVGQDVTSSVNATGTTRGSAAARWCWRSRGQCSPRPSMQHEALSPCSSESVCMAPFSSGSSKSGKASPRRGSCAWSGSLDADAHPVDAGQRGDVERAAVRVAPGEVVRASRAADQCRAARRAGERPRCRRGRRRRGCPSRSTLMPSIASSPGASVMSKKHLAGERPSACDGRSA